MRTVCKKETVVRTSTTRESETLIPKTADGCKLRCCMHLSREPAGLRWYHRVTEFTRRYGPRIHEFLEIVSSKSNNYLGSWTEKGSLVEKTITTGRVN